MNLLEEFAVADMHKVVAEYKLESALLKALGFPSILEKPYPCSDWIYDPYDSSFELLGTDVGYVIPQNSYERLRELGFKQCWIVYKDESELHINLETGAINRKQ